MLTEDLAQYILGVRTDLWAIATWNPQLWQSGPIAVVAHWWGRLRKGNPTDPANKYTDILVYAQQELAYRPAYPGTPTQGVYLPPDDGVPYRPPVRPPTKDEAEDEADAQIRTLTERFKKDWPLFAALGVGAYFIVASGIFR